MENFESKEIITKESIIEFVKHCEADMLNPNNGVFIAEGKRLADEFRLTFPNVSEKDLGTIIVVFIQAISIVAQCSSMDLSYVFEKMLASYSYCASDILKSIVDMI